MKMPQSEAVTSGIGFGFANNSSNQATIFLQLKPLSERHGPENSSLADAVRSLPPVFRRFRISKRFRQIRPLFPAWVRPAASQSRSRTSTISACRRSTKSAIRSSPRLNEGSDCSRKCASDDFHGSYLVTKFDRSKALAFGVTPQRLLRHDQRNDGFDIRQFLRLRYALVSGRLQAKAGQRTSPADLSRIYVANAAAT